MTETIKMADLAELAAGWEGEVIGRSTESYVGWDVEIGDLLVLPRVTFDHPDTISLDDMTPRQIATAVGVPVVLADSMGDVWDALQGHPALLFNPDDSSSGDLG